LVLYQLLKEAVAFKPPPHTPPPVCERLDRRGSIRGRGEVFKDAGAFGPRILEFLHPHSATLRLVEGCLPPERPTGLLREGEGGEAEDRFSATC